MDSEMNTNSRKPSSSSLTMDSSSPKYQSTNSTTTSNPNNSLFTAEFNDDEEEDELSFICNRKYRLNQYEFSLTPLILGREEFNRDDVPIQFKCTPDTLVHLCSKIVDAIPLPPVYKWNTDDICTWLRRYGYPQYQNTFRVNLINGHTLLLLDASALSAMNIKDFNHIKHIAYGIRSLFYFEMTKFGRSITLAPDFHYELYKLFRVKTGLKYELTRRSDLWRRMQLIREKVPNYTHWELLERWLAMVKEPKYVERIGCIHRYNIYKCHTKPAQSSSGTDSESRMACLCMPPCECNWTEADLRPPWRLKCLLREGDPDPEPIKPCNKCVPPCTCRWTSKQFMCKAMLKCLQNTYPTKYSPFLRMMYFNKSKNMFLRKILKKRNTVNFEQYYY